MRAPAVLLFGASALIFLLYIFASPLGLYPSSAGQVVLTLAASLAAYFAGRVLIKSETNETKKEKTMKCVFTYILVIYAFLILKFTVVDGYYGRDIAKLGTLTAQDVRTHLKEKCNLIPFATVRTVMKAYRNSVLNGRDVFVNIQGNLIAFMPTALLYPLVSDRLKKPFHFFLALSATVISIELIQTFTTLGSGDIDDYILNAAGAMAVYAVLHIKPVSILIEKITGLPYRAK